MVTLQKIPVELEAFIKQQELVQPKKAVSEYPLAIHVPLPDAITCIAMAQAGCEMSISDSFESIPNGCTITPKQNIAMFRKGLGGCYYSTLNAIDIAKKAGLKAIPIGRLVVLSY